MHTIYLSLGTNIGQREKYLLQALQHLHKHPHITLDQLSSVYETEPVGFTQQPNFLNMVVKGRTSLQPLELLDTTQQIEHELGRTREVRWGPRTIDIDILLYNHISYKTDNLVIPHPRLKERAFVLYPLQDLSPDIVIPGDTQTVSKRISCLKGEGVQKWKRKFKCGEDGFVLSES